MALPSGKSRDIMCRCCPYGPTIFNSLEALERHTARRAERNSVAKKTPKSFALFPQLPKELRLSIGKYTCAGTGYAAISAADRINY